MAGDGLIVNVNDSDYFIANLARAVLFIPRATRDVIRGQVLALFRQLIAAG